MKNIERWKFGTDNDYLISLVLQGKKTATTSIANDNQSDGVYSIICYSDGRDACLIKTEKIIRMKFQEMSWEYAKLEGENNNLQEWIEQHKRFFESIDSNFNHDTMIEFEIFSVIQVF